MALPSSSSVGQSFSSPFFTSQLPGLRALYDRQRKRKRKSSRELIEEDGCENESRSLNHSQGQESATYLYPSEAALPLEVSTQYRAAGQPFDQEPPGYNFPHRASEGSVSLLTPTQLAEELANLNPPLFKSAITTAFETHNLSQKQKHVGVLTTIMHTCILNRDFLRAQRAWGMVLRTELSGRSLDLRASGLWGLGAELLLRVESQIENGKELASVDLDMVGHSLLTSESNNITPISQCAFDKVKVYFEHLILHFPYRKTNPDIVSAVDFHKALFSLWVKYVQDQHTDALRRLTSESEGEDSDGVGSNQSHEIRVQAENIRYSILIRAGEIASDLDRILNGPPYSEEVTLLNLRGMISLWIADLCESEGVRNISQIGEEEGGAGNSIGVGDLGKASLARQQMEERQVHIKQAEGMFAKAEDKTSHQQNLLFI